MMTKSRRSSQHSSTILVTLSALTVLSLLAAYAVSRVVPRLRMAYQNAAWQEARLAAEAGVDAAMGDLLVNTAAPDGGTWQGWKTKRPDGSSIAAPVGGPIGSLLTGTLNVVTGLLSALLGGGGGNTTSTGGSTAITISNPIYLDNLKVSTATGIPTAVDVQLWALQPDANPHIYFRIRSMATCALPPMAYEAPANNDAALRRFSLRSLRPGLRKDDVGTPVSVPLPNVSRTVEVLVEPILPFELAAWTAGPISLGTTGTWCVDSFDSRDIAKCNPDGTYPGATSPKAQENGHVATNASRPPSSPYGPLISANGARVRGSVATNGGDDPSTPTHENVTGAMSLNPARIRDDFCREMRTVSRPSGVSRPPPWFGFPFIAGTEETPTQYLIPGDLDSFEVIPPGGGARGVLILLVNGNFDLNSPLTIPPSVTVQIFVRGNIYLRANANTTALSSNRAAKLQIFGESLMGPPPVLRAYSTASICAVFYGPTYDVSLDGGVNWIGSLVSRSLSIVGGGSGGIHYDEALANIGGPTSFRIARYIEDVRE